MADERLRAVGDLEKAYKDVNDQFERSKKLVKDLTVETDNLKDVQKELLQTAKDYKDVLKSTSDPKTIAALREQQALYTKVDETVKKHVTTTKQLEAAEKKLQAERVKEIQLQKAREKAFDDFTKKELAAAKAKEKARLDELKLQKAREKAFDDYAKKELQLQKQRERAQKVINDEANAYKVLTNNTNKAQDEFKRLAAQHGVNSSQAKAARDKFEQLDNALRKVNTAARDGRRDVGRYGEAWKAAQDTLNKFGVGISIGFAAREGLQVLVEYEDAVAKFRTIVSDLSDTQFAKYQTAITDVANTTKLSTTEIASSFETIAGLNASFAETPEGISKVTEAVATLTKASKGELQPTAENLVGIMNQFDLSADQANRTINVLAAGQAVGAANIAQSSEAYKNYGKVAAEANISLEKSQALIQTVGKFSIFGAEAGTKLRGVTLRLQAANLGYQSGMFNINDALKEYNEKLAAKTTAQDKDALSQEVFGAENITVGKILASNIPLIEKFEKGVTGTSEAQKAAAINANTLSNRWEEFKDAATTALTTNEKVGGSLNVLKDGLKFVTDNLGTIISVLGKAVTAFITFKTVMFSLKMKDRIAEWYEHTKAVKETGKAAGEASSGVKNFGQALKAIGWSVAIGLAIEFANAFIKIANGAAQAERQIEKTNKAMAKGEEGANKNIENTNKRLEKRLKLLENEKRLGKITNKEFLKQREAEIKKSKEQIEGYISLVRDRRMENQKDYFKAKQDLKDLGVEVGRFAKYNANLNSAELARSLNLEAFLPEKKVKILDALDRLEKFKAGVEGTGARIKLYSDALEGLGGELQDANVDLEEYTQGAASTGDLNEKLEERESLLRQIEDAENDLIKDELERNKQRLDIQIARDVEDLQNSTALESEKAELKKLIIAQYIRDINQLEEDARKAREERDKAELERLGNLPLPPIAIPEAEDFGLGIEEETAAKRLELLKDMSKSSEEIEIEGRDFRISLLEREIELRKELGLEIYDFELELAELQRAKQEKDRKKWLDAGKRALDELAKATNEYADGRVESQQKIIDSEQKLLDTIQNSVEKGTATTDQSIAKQEEKIAKAQAEKIRMEKEKQAIEFATAAITTFTNALESGKTVPQAFGDVALSSAGLKLILDQLPKFFHGTPDTGTKGIFSDQFGAVTGVTHANERVVDAENNAKLKGIDNDTLVDSALKFMELKKNPSIDMNGYIQMMMHPHISTPIFDDDRMVKEIGSLKKEIKGVQKSIQNLKFPESNVGKILAQAMSIIDKDSKGNSIETVIRKPRNNNFGKSQA